MQAQVSANTKLKKHPENLDIKSVKNQDSFNTNNSNKFTHLDLMYTTKAQLNSGREILQSQSRAELRKRRALQCLVLANMTL